MGSSRKNLYARRENERGERNIGLWLCYLLICIRKTPKPKLSVSWECFNAMNNYNIPPGA